MANKKVARAVGVVGLAMATKAAGLAKAGGAGGKLLAVAAAGGGIAALLGNNGGAEEQVVAHTQQAPTAARVPAKAAQYASTPR